MDKREEFIQAANAKAGQQLIDWSALQKTCLEKEPLVRKLFGLYLQQTPLWKKDLTAAFFNSDVTKMREVCHTVKGAVAAIHATACFAALDRLHQTARHGDLSEARGIMEKSLTMIDLTGELLQQILDG